MIKKPYKNKMLKPVLKDKVIKHVVELDKSTNVLKKHDPYNKHIPIMEMQIEEGKKFLK